MSPNNRPISVRISDVLLLHLPIYLVTISLVVGMVSAATTRPPTKGPTTRPTTKGPFTIGPTSPSTALPKLPVTQAPYYNWWNYPNPQTQYLKCRPKEQHTSWLCDPNGLIIKYQADYIDAKLNQIRWKSKCLCADKCADKAGVAVAVAVVPSLQLQKIPKAKEETAIREFADNLRSEWGFGTCDDSVVLLISKTNPKKTWISRGEVLKETITDKDVTALIKQTKDVTDIYGTVIEIGNLLSVSGQNDLEQSVAESGQLSTWTIVPLIALVIGFIIAIALAIAGGSYCGRKCGDSKSSASNKSHDSSSRNTRSTSVKSEKKAKKPKNSDAKQDSKISRAWFGRIGRNDQRGKQDSHSNMYTVPEDDEENGNDVYINGSTRSSNQGGSTRNNRNSYNNDNDDDNNGWTDTYDNRKPSSNFGDRPSGRRNSDRDSDRNSDRLSGRNSIRNPEYDDRMQF